MLKAAWWLKYKVQDLLMLPHGGGCLPLLSLKPRKASGSLGEDSWHYLKGPYLVKYSLHPGWYHKSASKSEQSWGRLGVLRSSSEGMAEGTQTPASLSRGQTCSTLELSL